MSTEPNPRAGELQLLRQLLRAPGPIQITHSATVAILDRLEANGEAFSWADYDCKLFADITATGRKALDEAAH
ncbi:MAG: hypothetical protein P0Y65_20560 [Candidatus Devosia phytovorans]|uniref:Uncharacterized protein n=1 Tax=Candidatus Devosia phytovorans TaxID=3121372 RepID=A0AAJ6AZF8_9HYPH|nr:hypothetical protein [Devosia sp.]WEK04535.1 MAG: hypothetical protein P0Y65_20560 [Devosia sp.]